MCEFVFVTLYILLMIIYFLSITIYFAYNFSKYSEEYINIRIVLLFFSPFWPIMLIIILITKIITLLVDKVEVLSEFIRSLKEKK